MGAKQIGKNTYVPVDTPQCEGEIIGAQPAYRREGGKQCWRKSQYQLDGKNYCAFHAGRVALEALLTKP